LKPLFDSNKLYSAYLENDPTGFVAGDPISIKIPNWVYKVTLASTGISVSETKLTSGDDLYLVYDSFNFGTVSTPFFGNTPGLLTNYAWKTDEDKPSTVSESVFGTYWMDLNLDSSTYNLNGLDYLGFSSKTYPYTYKYPANINTYMSLGATDYGPDSTVFKDPDLHYLSVNSAVLQFLDPAPKLISSTLTSNVYTRTRSYLDVVSSYGASGVEMSALYERLSALEVPVDGSTQSIVKSSVIAYIDDDNKSARIALNGQIDGISADTIESSTLRLTSILDATTTSTGHALQIGASNAANLRMDSNEISAYNNGAVASLNLSIDGGTTVFGGLLDSNDTYNNEITTTRRAMWMSSAGVFGYASSSQTKKQDIIEANLNPAAILSIQPKLFRYIKAVEEFGDDAPIELGMVAEDLHDAGLTHFVDYDDDGTIQGIHYSMYVVALQAVVRDLASRLAVLESK
jgi:hypothetical protein